MNFYHITLAAAAAGLASACSVSAPLSVQSSGYGLSQRGVALTIVEADAASDRGRFGAALQRSLTARSFAIDDSAGLVADYSFMTGSATAGLLSGEARPADAGAQLDWLAEPRRKHFLDECTARRMRGTLVLFDRVSGTMVYRGSASRTDCDFSLSDLDAMAEALVRDAVIRAQ